MKDGKYRIYIDGKERTIDADKFENNYEAIVGRYPDAKIRVSRENQLGDIPLKNYRKAIGSGYYSPYVSIGDEAKEVDENNISPGMQDDGASGMPVYQSADRMPDSPEPSTDNPVLDYPKSRFVKGKGKDTTIFGMPYEVYKHMNPETQSYYYQQAIDEEKNAKRNETGSRIDSTRSEVSKDIQDEYLRNMEEKEKFRKEHPFQSAMQDMVYGSRFARTGIDTGNPIFTNSKIRDLYATANRLDDAKDVIDESKKKGNTNFVMGSLRGLWKAFFDVRTWDSGITGILDNNAVLSAIDAVENGKADAVQKRLLDAAAIEVAVNQEIGDDIGMGYKAGKTTGESLSFMLEFFVNPASGMGESMTRSVVKRGIEKFGKDAMRTGLKKMEMSVLRAGTDLLGAGAMSLTTGMGRVAEDAEKRMIGTIRPVLDQDGYIRYDSTEGGDSFGKALIKAYGSNTIENFSELLGNYFAPLFSVATNVTSKGISKVGLSRVNDAISNIKASDWAKSVAAFEKHAQWNGTIGEYAEEVAGGVLNSIFIGDQALDTNPDTGVFNLHNNIETFLSVSVMGGFMSGIKSGGYYRHKYNAGKRLKKAESNGERVFENREQWNSVRESIQNANEEGIVLMMEDVYRSGDYTPEQKIAVFSYAAALKEYQGANLADLRRHVDGDVPSAQLEAEGAFDEGYSLSVPQEKNEAKLILDQSVADVRKVLGLSSEADVLAAMNGMGDSPTRILMTMDERGYPEESIRKVSDYLNAKARYDGMIESAKDGIEGEIESQVQYIDRNTHKDGNLYSAVMRADERKVYVTGGSVVLQEDGSVDHEKSSKSIVVRDAETDKIEMVDVRDLLSVQPGISAESHKVDISEQIRQDYAQRASDEINGVLPFAPGDVYAVLNPESGTREELTVLQANGDIVVVSDDTGQQMEMAKEELQSFVDRERMSRMHEKRLLMQGERGEILPTEQDGSLPDGSNEAGVTPTGVSKVLEDGRTAVLTASDDTYVSFDIYDFSGNLVDSDEMPLDEFYRLQDYVEEPDIELDDYGLPVSEELASEPVAHENNNEEESGNLSVSHESESSIPVDENGTILYHRMPVEKTIANIDDGSLEPEEVDGFVSANKTEAEKLLKKLSDKSPKIGTDKAKYLVEKQEWQEKLSDAREQVDYWNEVETQLQMSRIQPGDKTVEEITAMGDPVSGEEFAAMMLGKGKLPLLYDDYKRETGFGNNEASGMFGLFAGRDKGGMTIEEAGEKLMEMDEANGTNFFDRTDANAGRDAIIDLLATVKTRGGLINLIKNSREKMAERERQAEIEADELAKEQWYRDNAHMTQEEHELWIQGELLSESNGFSMDEDIEFYNNFVDDIFKEDRYDRRRERTDGQGTDVGERDEQRRVFGSRNESHEILHGEESISPGRVEGYQRESGEVAERPAEILHPANDGLQDSASRGEIEAEDIEVQRKKQISSQESIVKAEQEVDPSPTEAQKEAGNYKKGHIKVDGFDITIENPKGSERSGVDADGKPWSIIMNNTYGYIRGTEGVDGDHIDIFLGNSGDGVYVVDQVKEDGSFDEHKVMYGFASVDEAKEAYLSNYSSGWKGLGNITGVSKETFKKWVDFSHRKTKPFAEYKIVQEHSESERDDVKQEENDGDIRFRTERDDDVIKENHEEVYRAINDFQERNVGAGQILVIYSPKTLREQLIAMNFAPNDIDKYERWLREGEVAAIYTKKNGGLIILLDTNISPEELNAYLWHEHTHKAFDELYEESERQRYIDQLYNDLLPYAEEDFANVRRLYSDETEDAQKEECLAWFVEKSYKYYGEKQGIFIDGLINSGIDSNGTIKNIYNYIHHGTRREEPRESVERGDGKGVENDVEGGGEKSVEMRNATRSIGNAEGSGSSRNDFGGIREERTGEIPESTGKESESGGKARRESRVELSEKITRKAETLADKLHTPVKIVSDVNEITHENEKLQGRMRKSKGWFDPKTGEVVVVVPNASSVADVQATVLHEVVAHNGLRKLFGEHFDNALMSIYKSLPENVRKDIAKDALRDYGSDLIIATEEYLARQAEKNEMPGWWDKVVSSFKDFLRKMDISLEISDNDVRYLLWRSRKSLEQNNPFEAASDVDMKNRLGIGEYGEKKRYRETINAGENLFNEQSDGADKNSSLLEVYRNRILELNGRISLLERKIDSHISAEEFSNEVIEEIKKEIGSDIISEIGRRELTSLLHQVKNAKTKKSLERIFLNVKRIALAAQSRKLQRVMDKLLTLKVQDVNGKNMSIAKNVDDSTRRIFSFIRGKLSDMKKSGLEDDIMYLMRENRKHREEIARLERTVRESKDAETKDEVVSAIETYKKTIEENKERIQELKQEKNEIEKVVADAGDLDIEKEMAALNEKMDMAAQEKAVWTQGDSERMAALNIISGQLMNKQHDFEMQSIERDILQRMLENTNLYKDRRAEVSENKRRQITNAINENRRQVVALERLINDTRFMQVQQLQMTIAQLEELINNGKDSLLRRTEEEVKRKSRIIGQSIRTVEGKQVDLYDKKSGEEGLLKKFFSAPLGSFEYMCKRINTKTLGKDGFLYKYFIEGKNGVMKAYDTYILGMEVLRESLDNKSKEIFGKKYARIWSLSDKVENSSGVHFVDTNNGQRYGTHHSTANKGYGVRYEVPLSKGQAMYIYQVWKMNDGRTKLELQGIDEESIAEIRDFIGEKYIKFADWIQEELLPDLREKYNAKYNEIYGTSLAAIKDYVPLRIVKKSIRQDSDLSEDKERKQTLEERAGSLINRVVNTNPVDITMNAFDVMYEHGRQMEGWNAYARVRRDLDAVLSNSTFRNLLDANTRGSFRNFYDAAAVATSVYHPDQNKYMDEILGKLSKGIVGGNIAWRLSTALKQILSAPAFWGYSQSPLYMKSLLSNATKMPVTFKWCMENIPSFRERVTKGTIGNEKLDERGISKLLDKYIETGMIPNKLVDAVTCSIGAKSIFDYKYGQLLKSGLVEADARNQALMDADIYYNQTQQSSHPAFLSPMQMSRSIVDRMVTTYQNSNIGYVRKVLSAYYDLTRSLKWKELQMNYTDMYMEEGVDRDEASRMAYRRLLNENKKSAFEAILFGWGMNLLWNIGSKGLLGLFAGNDDDNNLAKGISFFLTSPIKGMPGGNLLESIASGYGMNPLLVYNELDKFMKEVNLAVNEYGLISPEIAYATLEKASRYGGVDLEVLGNVYLGIEGLVRDGALSDDKMIDLMFILNSPKSNRAAVAKELYKDESIFSFAEKVARANKYISKRDPWEGWVPGVKALTKRREKEIEKDYKRLRMADEEKAADDERKIADKHRRKLNELKGNPLDMADYIDNHMEQHKIYQKYD